ncbi:hypothetical protein [Ensifer sp. 2TAB8]|uniref:hypothetical protein n=1 Tax=Ensifer sp. 2TAB8 TaxID=3233006 RepID=UPI003F8FA219
MRKDEQVTDAAFVLTRRHALECMVWAGTGVVWTVSGGIPKSLSLLDTAQAADAAQGAMTFLQISDSHIGFDKEAKVTAVDTLTEATDRIKALPVKPAFMIHTGDITHLRKASRLSAAASTSSEAMPSRHSSIATTSISSRWWRSRQRPGLPAPKANRPTATTW